MPSVAIAASSEIAANAGERVAREGGNAVDSALAAALVSSITEVGVCSPGGSAFITVYSPGQEPVTIDGTAEVPGRGLPASRPGRGVVDVYLDYGSGVRTCVGHGSVATPGCPAAIEFASEQYGEVPMAVVFEPAIEIARNGFPLSRASHHYLKYCGDVIFGRYADSHRALHHDDNRPLDAGDLVHVPHLADTLQSIARDGADSFYRGDIAKLIIRDMRDNDGLLTADDLAAYEVIARPSLAFECNGWNIASNPPPAVGGAMIAALLMLMGDHPKKKWSADDVQRYVTAQNDVLRYRKSRMTVSDSIGPETIRLLDSIASGTFREPPSTIHASAVDDSGCACAITISAGYGSGVMPPGTGIWMNNSLGEYELNPNGFYSEKPGTRLVSNMAPTVAHRGDDTVLAIGSPGADRITTAIGMTLLNLINLDMTLIDAVKAPRLHVFMENGVSNLACESGFDMSKTDLPLHEFAKPHMYFGGVAATMWQREQGFSVAADARRTGGTSIINR